MAGYDRFRLESYRLVINVANHKYQGEALLVLFLLALTESNDIASIYGGNPAAEEKWSPKSARENAGRSGGGRNHYHDCVTDY